jgi:hypothetical protein
MSAVSQRQKAMAMGDMWPWRPRAMTQFPAQKSAVKTRSRYAVDTLDAALFN